jgi:hypothetical protein
VLPQNHFLVQWILTIVINYYHILSDLRNLGIEIGFDRAFFDPVFNVWFDPVFHSVAYGLATHNHGHTTLTVDFKAASTALLLAPQRQLFESIQMWIIIVMRHFF